MAEQEQIEAKLGEAFHLMYDGMPEPVQLCHKTYRVVAVNPACERYGRKPGVVCAQGCPAILQQIGGQREDASGCLHHGAGSRRGLGTFSVQSWDFHTSPVPSVVPVPSTGLGV